MKVPVMPYFVTSLRQPLTLSSIEPVRLVATNIVADSYNRDYLLKLPGKVYQFEAFSEGDERRLASLAVQKTLG
ncbi:hypothetical protein DPMN_064389 [Dreissena polymorpha]|uniref:Uncharacterized protein n=1 Tax=Dreissena polymorpha TaxID=45954 RepID=A0A9D4CD42_DREPO|nr:hypothetical protein DPMN_064372 [Dreissena polymorpha]KAH3721462.1 hypothetical protein DPMN_064389 [Dreissena polymorpha]